jgi:multimeric flavodoxin WrbA
MAEAAAAARAETPTTLLHAGDAGPDDLLAADGYIFASPENLVALSGVFKHFVDRCCYPVLGRIEGRPYRALICAGSGGTSAQTPEAILAEKHLPPEDLARCAEAGAAMAAGLALGVF